MITKEQFGNKIDDIFSSDMDNVIGLIERQLEFGSKVTKVKSSLIKTPWYKFLPVLRTHLATHGWTLDVEEKWEVEGGNSHDFTDVLYKVLTLS